MIENDAHFEFDQILMSETSKGNLKVPDQLMQDFWRELKTDLRQSIISQFSLMGFVANAHEGADIETIHNVRQGVWQDEAKWQEFKKRQPYDKSIQSKLHGGDKKYQQLNAKLREQARSGKLKDAYTGQSFAKSDIDRTHMRVDLDHVVATKEIYNDPATGIIDQDLSRYANDKSNLKLVNRNSNRSKSDLTMDQAIERNRRAHDDLVNNRTKIQNDQSLSAEERQTKLQNIDNRLNANEAEMKKVDQTARRTMNRHMAKDYYLNSETLKKAGKASAKAGFTAAKNQAVGIVMMTTLDIVIPEMEEFVAHWKEFGSMSERIEAEKSMMKRIGKRLASKWKEVLKELAAGIFNAATSGFASTIMTIIINAFVTTTSSFGKLLLDSVQGLYQAVKTLIMNPEHLDKAALIKSVIGIVGTTVIGTIGMSVAQAVRAELLTIPLLVPVADPLSAVLAALVTGVLSALFMTGLNHLKDVQAALATAISDIGDQSEQFEIAYNNCIGKIDDAYRDIMTQMVSEFAKYHQLQTLAFDLSVAGEVQFGNSIKFAQANHVGSANLLTTRDDINRFFYN